MPDLFPQPEPEAIPLLEDVAGYLNFSSGTADPQFLARLDQLFRLGGSCPEGSSLIPRLSHWIELTIARLQESQRAFHDATQAREVRKLVFDQFLPAYRRFHRDLLHHQSDAELWRPFFLGRCCEAILSQGPPWHETERIVEGALAAVNDYVGYRPTPVLSSGVKCEPYPHEFVRPIPLFVAGAGVATGRYEELLRRALAILEAADQEVLERAWFDLHRLEEVALDPRAYDFDHPVNRRPNYHFGQWDPREISPQGYYRRFVLQQITLDALLARYEAESTPDGVTQEELLQESAAVLAGTILMAAGTSGDSPSRHDSTVTLSTLLPHIAAYRDDFYQRLLTGWGGAHGERLREEARRLRQPLGGARQHLNHELARRRAMQLQRVHLALLYARMGRREAALGQADSVRVASARILTEIYCRLTAGHDALDRDDVPPVVEELRQIDELLHRAVECGALVDPWNVVGFAGNFSLFPALENTVHDWRVDELVELVEQILDLAARAWSEAAAIDDRPLEREFSGILANLAAWWDRHATASVDGVKRLVAKEIEVSANLVAGALNAWHKAGAAAGDVAFWRLFVDQFDSSKAFQLVIEALLDHADAVASRALMMQWVNQRERTSLEEGEASFHPLAFRWLSVVEQTPRELEPWKQIVGFFDYLEANAEEYWRAPRLWVDDRQADDDDDDIPFGDATDDDDDDDEQDDESYEELYDDDDEEYELLEEGESDFDEQAEYGDDEDDDGLFQAAYDDMSFRGSSEDGVEGDLADDGDDAVRCEWEEEARRLQQRLAFLSSVARLWRYVAVSWGGGELGAPRRETFRQWLAQANVNYRQLLELLESVHRHRFRQPTGSHDSLVEFDRLRTLKETLVQQIIATCVDTAGATRMLIAAGEADVDAKRQGEPFDPVSLQLLRRVLNGDADGVRAMWQEFLDALRPRKMLYVPHSRGGDPRQTVYTRALQRILQDLLSWLPRLGLIRETCQLLDMAQQMESENPVGQGAVTEFDTLFENGYQAIVQAIIDSAPAWPVESDDALDANHRLVELLQQLAERQLDRWLNHSRTLRLSVVERLSAPDEWQRFVEFVERYGSELFTQKFLSLGNLRGILHQGVGDWLQRLSQDDEAVEQLRLLQELEVRWPREDAVEQLSLAIEAVVENYREYRDYNTTTTQSDHGELLYTLIDFLRQRAAYDRVAWNLKPVVWTHEMLVRRGLAEAAAIWRQAFVERTAEAADAYLQRLAALSRQYGMQLATVSDRLGEKFVRPLLIDQLRALVEPAMTGSGPLRSEAFATMVQEIGQLADEPHGAGLDLPDWLSALEEEVTAARSRLSHVSSSARLSSRMGQTELSWDDIQRQLGE